MSPPISYENVYLDAGGAATAMGGRRGVQGSTKARGAGGPAPVVEGTGALSALCLIMSQ